jgi:O-antigen/teichoic acid export membrane protein
MFFSVGMKLILQQADIIVVGSLLGVAEAGVYAVASRLAAFTILGKRAADSIVAPMIAEFYATQERLKLSKLVIVSARTVTAFTLAAALGLLVLGPFLLGLFGSEFRQGYAVMSLLLLGHFFKASFASAGFLLSMTGHQDQTAIVSAVCAAINVVLLFLLVPEFGLIGAGLAAAITNAIWSSLLALYAWKLLGINATAFARIPQVADGK